MKLYRGNKEIADIEIDEKNTYESELQGGDLISCNFTLPELIEIKKDDYTIWRGKKFYAKEVIPVHRKKTNEFDYNFKLYDFYFFLGDALHRFNEELDFYFFGDLEDQARLLVASFNKIGRNALELGNFPTTEPKNLKFSNTDCESVLHQLCKEWGVEFQFTGNTLSFAEKVGNATDLTFEFKDGIRGIERKKVNDASLITRLYAFGSEKNIPPKYGTKRLRIAPLERNISKYGVIEAVKNFDDVYPHRTGTISSIGDDICKFSDSGLDFDVKKQAIEGVVVKLTFTSGDLSGQEFEIHNYDHATKGFDIIEKTDETNTVFPNKDFRPKVGDKYVLHDIIMPQSYIDEAEYKLRQKATEYINKYSVPQMSYEITLDYVKLRRDTIELNVGDITTTVDNEFGISSSTRIIGLSQVLVSPSKYTIKVGDKATISYLKRTLAKQVELDLAFQIERDNRRADYRKMRRGLLQMAELQESIFDQEGYFDPEKIKPLSIETNMLSVGSRSLRMSFEGLNIKPNFNNNPELVNISASKLVHFTIADEVKEWNFKQKTLTLPDASKYYYLYAECHKEGAGGEYHATAEKLNLEDGAYYYFLIGVIHSAIDGVRGASLQYGQTFINGKFITTGVVKSANGSLVFDLDNNRIIATDGAEIIGNIKFKSKGSNVNLSEWAGTTTKQIEDVKEDFDTMEIGGDNLLLKSDSEKYSSSYALADYYLTEKIAAGEDVVLTIWGDLGSDREDFWLYNSGGYVFLATPQKIRNGVYQAAFKWRIEEGGNTASNEFLRVYQAKSTGTSKSKISKIQLQRGTRGTDYSKSVKDVQAEIKKVKQDAIAANQSYIASKNFVTQLKHRADLDGVRTAAEQKAIDEATKKMNLAKAYAVAQDKLLKTQQQAYADKKITKAEQKAIAVAAANSKLAEERVKTYADGKVTAAERKTLNELQNKYNEAVAEARRMDTALEIPGKNLLKNPNFENFDSWNFTANKDIERNNARTANFGTVMSIWNKCEMSQNVQLKAGSYQFIFYARNWSESNTGKIYVRVGSKNSYFTIHSGAEYQRIVFDFELSEAVSIVAKIEAVGASEILIAQAYLGKLTPITQELKRAQKTAEEARKLLKKEISESQQAFSNFKNTTLKSFSDGIVDKPEKEALKLHLKNIEKELGDLKVVFNSIYLSRYITSAYKSTMNSSYVSYKNSFDALENAINNTIGDGKITPAERNAVNSSLEDYPKKLKALRKVLEQGARNIENAVKEEAQAQAISHAKALDDAQVIGGTNLLRKSDQKVSNSSYALAEYYLTEKIAAGEDVVLTIWGELGSDREDFWLYNSGGYVFLATPQKIRNGVYQAAFKWRIEEGGNTASNEFLRVYQAKSTGTSKSVIEKIQLERGTKGTDHSLSSADIEDQIGDIGKNLLQNPNFENFDNWNFTANKDIERNNARTANFGTVMSIWNKCEMSQNVQLKAGSYQFIFYARNWSESNTGKIYVRVGSKNSYFTIHSGAEYQRIVFDFELSEAVSIVAKIEAVGASEILIAQAYLGELTPITRELHRVHRDIKLGVDEAKQKTINDISYRLGYGNYSNMIAKIKEKGTPLTIEGMLRADLIDVDVLWAKIIETHLILASSIISQNNGFSVAVNALTNTPFRVTYPTGETWKEIVFEDGQMKEVWYDKSGQRNSWVDERGFHLINFSEERWVDREFKYIGSSKSQITKNSFGIYSDGNGDICYNVNGVSYHEYVSSSTSGTLTNPNEHHHIYKNKNFNSSIPDGYYYDTYRKHHKLTICQNSQEDGVPYHQPEDIVVNNHWGNWYEIRCFEMKSGKIASVFSFIVRVL